MRPRACKSGLLILHKQQPPRCLPLKSVQLSINTKCVLASIEAVLEYHNDDSSPAEVEFILPMDSLAVVTGLSAQLEGRAVRGVVRGKEEAKDDYDDAVSSGQTAVYGEQEGEDMFRMLLGNLPAGGKAELRLSLLQEMQREEGDEGPIRFSLPTTLKPRYSPSGAIGADSSDTAVEAKYELSVAMRVEYTGGLCRVESPSHLISTGVLEEGVWQVQLIDSNPLEKDLLVFLYPSHPTVPSILWGLPTTSSQKETPAASKLHPFAVSPAMMLSFLPQFSREEREGGEVSSEIIFVIDRSGSMNGKPIASARATLELLLRSLSPGCAFNVVGFGTMFKLLFPEGSKRYDTESLQNATQYASKMQADMMGTQMLAPLEEIFRLPRLVGLSREVIVLTDGAVSNTEKVLRCVRDNRSKGRVFSIGIGSGVSSELVRGMAEAGGGRAVFVLEGERMQGKILRLLSDAMSPCYTDVELKAPKGVHLFPSKMPQLFPNDRLVVYGIVDGCVFLPGEKLYLSYKLKEKLFSHELSLDCSEKEGEEGHWIHKLVCSAVLREWEQTDSKRSECVQLSCDTNMVCAHTALVGVDTEGGKIVEGSMRHIKLKPPQPISCNYPMPMFFGCASSSPPSHRGRSRGRGGSSAGVRRSKAKQAYSPVQVSMECSDAMEDEEESLNLSSDNTLDFFLEKKKKGKKAISLPPKSLISPLEGCIEMDGYSLPNQVVAHGSTVSPHEQLISQQTAQGYWEVGEIVIKLLNFSERQKDACPKGMSEREWITLLCLIALEKYTEFEDEWKLVAKKGWRWLRGCQLSVNLEEATEIARQAMK